MRKREKIDDFDLNGKLDVMNCQRKIVITDYITCQSGFKIKIVIYTNFVVFRPQAFWKRVKFSFQQLRNNEGTDCKTQQKAFIISV